MKSRTAVVVALGTAQTLAWASSFYLPAMLAAPMARDLGVLPSHVYAALSMALIISALVSPWAGRTIDRLGGRRVLLVSSGLFATALVMLGLAQGPWSLAAAWAVMGLAMGCGLYDAAFAALVRLFGSDSRRAITGITLIAGFASTVGWPLSAWMDTLWGWRGACFGWAALHLLVGLPLNLRLPRAAAASDRGLWVTAAAAVSPATAQAAPLGGAANPAAPAVLPAPATLAAAADREPAPVPRGRLVQVATLFTLMGFVSTSIATHLPALLQVAGATLAAAVALAALAGPAQVAARLIEIGVLSRYSPLLAARLATLGHPLGAVLLLIGGVGWALPFVVIHGLGNGLLTIVRGTLPLALFGAQGYGARQGLISLPGRLLGALSPWLMGLAIERWGAGALWLTTASGLAALLTLLLMRLPAGAAGAEPALPAPSARP